MRRQLDDDALVKRRRGGADWFTAVSIGMIVIVCVAAFVFAYVRIDPYLSDFVSSGENDAPTPVLTPAPTPAPTSTPDGTPEGRRETTTASDEPGPMLYFRSP